MVLGSAVIVLSFEDYCPAILDLSLTWTQSKSGMPRVAMAATAWHILNISTTSAKEGKVKDEGRQRVLSAVVESIPDLVVIFIHTHAYDS